MAKVIRNDFYVDDLLTGADNFEDLSKIRDQAKEILSSAEFDLTNHTNFETDTGYKLLTTDSDSVKMLGIHWATKNHLFEFRLEDSCQKLKATKRNILSGSSRLFGPLGLLSPIAIVAKIML